MLGHRLEQAKKYSLKTFIKYHGYDGNVDGADTDGRYKEDGGWTCFKNKEDYLRWKKSVMGTYRKTKVFCSNPFCSCGNPRRQPGTKQGGLTRQELLADLSFKEIMVELLRVIP